MGQRAKSNLKQHMTRWSIGLMDQFLPPRCLSCGAGAQEAGRICSDCWKILDFLQGPACGCCGFPFDFGHLAEDFLCGACLVKTPSFDRARAALRYDDGSKRMIIAFKHSDRTDYADFFAQLLIQANQGSNLSNAIVIPVPLHKKRLGGRRYNQAALMAGRFAEKKALPYIPDMILRQKHTPPQQGNYGHRKRNLAGAFRVKDKYNGRIKGRRIVLIDDVYTTGATAGACARILKHAGAEAVEILTVARVC